MDISVFLGVLTVASGFVLVMLGYLISVKQRLNLINGVDFSSLTDAVSFAKYLGKSFTITGILMLFLGLAVYFKWVGLVGYSLIIMAICIIPLPAFMIAKNKYTKRAL
ncbi:hypothetical protein [Alkalimonas sp.]|uniref:hypothetical protein n=1 Tax=Alkalimonas sp. TaxID=1872453 RepID=UPI00263BB841|nr:hypothetical protein [Alkalimonas sp.]MCC5825304.1 hypothetical protein [Alkalimonas sp.]